MDDRSPSLMLLLGSKAVVVLAMVAFGVYQWRRRERRRAELAMLDAPVGRRQPGPKRPTAEQAALNVRFAADLERAGFFARVSADDAATLRRELREKGWDALFEETGRVFHADAESLAEGGVVDFIRTLAPYLAGQGVVLPELRDVATERSYTVLVDGVPFSIYTEADAERELQEIEPGRSWALGMVRGFALVNQLLARAGSAERLYAVGGGNDLFAWFLTPEQFEIIRSHPDMSPRDCPYMPVDQDPHYGMTAP